MGATYATGENTTADVKLSLSEESLAALRLGARAAGRSLAEAIFQLLQMAAIIGAGFWTVYIYINFQKQSNDLALRSAKLQETQARLAIELARLDAEKRAIEVRRARQNPIILAHDVKAVRLHGVPGGRFRYFITYNYTIENVSDRQLEVDRVIVRGFYATTDQRRGDSHEVNGFDQSTPVRWSRVFKRAHLLNDWQDGSTVSDSGEDIVCLKGGGGTGMMNSGELQRGGVDLILEAKPTDLIGFKVRLRIQNGEELPDRRYMSTIRTIKSTE